jgi:aminoglycoside phosphotransferase (APT) family kinase protein
MREVALSHAGTFLEVVVRCYDRGWSGPYLEMPERGWRTLQLLEGTAVDAPDPLHFDPQGDMFGVPTVVMSRLPGRGLLRPADRDSWLTQYARGLARIHQVSLEGVDTSFLPQPGEATDSLFERVTDPPNVLLAHPYGGRIVAALSRRRWELHSSPAVLCHGDYWSGNTLWLDGRLTGVVDWDWSRIEHPGADLGYTRMELALLFGVDALDVFSRTYEGHGGVPVPEIALWDLLGAIQMIEIPMERWLARYTDIDPVDLDTGMLQDRLTAFIVDSLARV